MRKQNKVAFFNILSTVLLRGISLFTAPLFARLLSDASYGIVSLYTIWVSVAAIAFTLQTGGTLVNARVEYEEDRQHAYQSSVMTLSLLFFLICSAVVILFLPQVAALLKLSRVLVLLILFHSFGSYCLNFLNSKFTYEFKADKNMFVSLGITLTTVVLSVALILLMPEGQEHYGRILGLALTYGGLGVGICIYVLAKGRTFYNREYWTLALTLSLPVMFYSLSDLVLGQCDRVMLQWMMNESMVGQYSMAYNFGGIMFTIFAALNNSWTPFFFEDMKQGQQLKMKTQAGNFLEVFTVLCCGFILLATEVYHIYAGQEFREGTLLIPIFVSSYYLNFLCTFPVNYEYYYKKTKVVAVLTVGTALLNLGLNYVLIQLWGVAGAALATAVSHGVQFLGHYIYVRYILRKGDYPFGIALWAKYVLAYFGVVAAVYLTRDMWLLRWGFGAAIGLWALLRIRRRKVLL